MRTIFSHGSTFVVGEFESDHDFPTSYSENLVNNAEKFYAGLRFLTRNETHFELLDREIFCNEEFSIKANSYSRRGEYHMTINQWLLTINSAEGKLIDIDSHEFMGSSFKSIAFTAGPKLQT